MQEKLANVCSHFGLPKVEPSEAKNEPYITLPEFAKAVGAVVLAPEEDGKRRKVAKAGPKAGGDKGGGKGAGDAMEAGYKTSAEDRLQSAANRWVAKRWEGQKQAAMAGDNPRVKAEELNQHEARCAHPSVAFMRLCKYRCSSCRKSGRDVPGCIAHRKTALQIAYESRHSAPNAARTLRHSAQRSAHQIHTRHSHS